MWVKTFIRNIPTTNYYLNILFVTIPYGGCIIIWELYLIVLMIDFLRFTHFFYFIEIIRI